jgi:predicted nucleotidyltransferase
MNGQARLDVSKEQIAAFCRKWNVTELSLFGSVLRDDFGPHSDIDVLVTFAPDVKIGVFGLMRMRDELTAMFGRKVDLVERRLIEQSNNYIRRKHILDTTEVVYGS